MKKLQSLKILKDAGATRLWLVKDVLSGEYLAEKTLKVGIDFQRRLFENEMIRHSELSHRYIIRFVEKRDEDSFLMEFASFGNLTQFARKAPPLGSLIDMVISSLKGLSYVHESGLVHNDIKPSNILISKDSKGKLSDFAFCGEIGKKTFDDVPDYFLLGTNDYRKPKISNNINEITNDIFSVGVILFRLFQKEKMINNENLMGIQPSEVQNLIKGCLTGSVTEVHEIIGVLGTAKRGF